MGSAIALREDFDGAGLRGLAKATKDAGQSRRLLALAEIYDGGARSDAARIGGVGLQVIRDWVLRFNDDGAKGLIDRKAPGQVAKLNAPQRRALAALVERRADPGDPWCCALAPQGPCALDIRRVPHIAGRDHRGPGTEVPGVPQGLGAPAPLCAERVGDRGF